MSATKEATVQWEKLLSNGYSTTYRLQVFGGWVVKYETWGEGQHLAMSTVFVPDPQHEWSL